MTAARRAVLLGAGPVLFAPARVRAQAFPTRPVGFVAPSGPGATAGTIALLVAKAAGETLEQPVVVENRHAPACHRGGGVAKAPPDGRTTIPPTPER